jgi:mRNA deadenylase 3'-5' endonuclease subunit Ccr4
VFDCVKAHGSCIAWDTSVFDKVQHWECPFSAQVEDKYYHRDGVSIYVLLKHKETGRTVLVGNTHLFWNPLYADVKLFQAALVMARLQELKTESKADGAVLCGDFNSLPMNDVYYYMTHRCVCACVCE